MSRKGYLWFADAVDAAGRSARSVVEDYRHEGHAAYMVADGRTTGTSSSYGVLIRYPDADQRAEAAWKQGRTTEKDDIYELVPWSGVTGWQVSCVCGWRGTTWKRAETAEAGDDPDPETALLPDGRTVEEAAHTEWSEHVEPSRRLAAVEAAADEYAAAARKLDAAVRAARAGQPPATWSEIGRATGMSRQGAHERWSG